MDPGERRGREVVGGVEGEIGWDVLYKKRNSTTIAYMRGPSIVLYRVSDYFFYPRGILGALLG